MMCIRGPGDSAFLLAYLHAPLQCCFNLHDVAQTRRRPLLAKRLASGSQAACQAACKCQLAVAVPSRDPSSTRSTLHWATTKGHIIGVKHQTPCLSSPTRRLQLLHQPLIACSRVLGEVLGRRAELCLRRAPEGSGETVRTCEREMGIFANKTK
jgi:hypothetical protein